jgi:hypothetical protein
MLPLLRLRKLSVGCFIVCFVCNSSITCSEFEHTIDYASNK